MNYLVKIELKSRIIRNFALEKTKTQMKKLIYILTMCMVIGFMLASCEKEVYDVSPTMEAYYIESAQLPTVSLDSVTAFENKVNVYVSTYPQAKGHRRYEQILANIKAASLRITITTNYEWKGDTIIHF